MGYLLDDVYSVKNSFYKIDDVKRCALRGVSKAITKTRIVKSEDLIDNKKKERHYIELTPE